MYNTLSHHSYCSIEYPAAHDNETLVSNYFQSGPGKGDTQDPHRVVRLTNAGIRLYGNEMLSRDDCGTAPIMHRCHRVRLGRAPAIALLIMRTPCYPRSQMTDILAPLSYRA